MLTCLSQRGFSGLEKHDTYNQPNIIIFFKKKLHFVGGKGGVGGWGKGWGEGWMLNSKIKFKNWCFWLGFLKS